LVPQTTVVFIFSIPVISERLAIITIEHPNRMWPLSL
jgi:hypothetical protein